MRIVMLIDREFDLNAIETRTGGALAWLDAYVLEALRGSGHDVVMVHNQTDVASTIRALSEARPRLVFNLAQHAHGREEWCAHVPALLDLLRLPYTGAGPLGHMLSGNKALSKQIVRDAGVAVPEFAAVPVGAPVPRWARFPALVKVLTSGGSNGLARSSLVRDRRALARRIRYLHDTLGVDAIVEEFVGGTEYSVTILGNRRLTVLPICEWIFDRRPGALTFLTEQGKWNGRYRRQVGIRYRRARASAALHAELVGVATLAYRLLHLRDYGNIDVRVGGNGAVYFLDGNANPGLRPVSKQMESLPFDDMVRRIVREALARADRSR